MDGLAGIAAAVAAGAVPIGVPLGWAWLLNLRDRRQARGLQAVLDGIDERNLRGRVAVQVRGGLFWPRQVVRVDLLDATRSEIWDLLGRLSERLSSGIRLELTGPVNQPLMATFTGRV